MNKIHILNCSPRKSKSTSHYLIQKFNFDAKVFYISDAATAILECDILLIVSPVYVDGLPSEAILKLMQLSSIINTSDINIYALVNCGFPEGHQTKIALDMVKEFAIQNNLTWSGALGIGGGEFLLNSQSMPDKVPMKQVVFQVLKTFSKHIENGENFETRTVEVKIPKFLFKFFATQHWYKLSKANGIKRSDLSYKPFD